MTNTELKNNIDAAITNKTSASSITPANVGEQIKSTVDYVDQEIAAIPTSTSLPYREYVGYVQFSSNGNALNTEVFNDIEAGIYFSLNSTGVYILNVYTSEFTTKTIISPFDRISGNPAGVRLPIFDNTTGVILGYYTINRWNNSTVRMHFWDTSNNLVNPYTLLGTRAILTDIKIYN